MTDTDVRRIEDKVDNLALAFARLEGSLNPTLNELTSRAADQESDLADHKARKQLVLDDHEKRIRGLERFRYSVPSVAVLSLLVDLGLGLYIAFH